MLSFAGSLKVFVAVDSCDLRKSFDGLHALVTERLREAPQTGALFVFTNRRRTRLKILFWDRTGLWVCTKRLEQGTFSWPRPMEGAAKLALTPEALTLLTDGIDLRDAKLRPWYQREQPFSNVTTARRLLLQTHRRMTPREAELTRQLEAALAAVATLQAENALLRQKVDLLVRRVFGSTSERLSAGQLELLLALPAPPPVVNEPPVPAPAPVRARKERTPRLPENLPVIEEVLEPAAVQAAPEQWRRIGQEVSEQLDYEPGRFLCRRLVRPKYVRKDDRDAAPIMAPLPPRLQDRSLPAPGLLAHVLVSKYCDHLPLYRQERLFATRHGVNLPRQTLARWVELAADWLLPVYQQIQAGVLTGGYVQVDETPIDYLDPGGGQTGQGYFWVCAVPHGDVVFHWETSRAAECLGHVLPADFTGIAQCDGYAAYPAFARQHPRPLTLAGCWAHVRRKFHDALEQSPRLTGWLLRQLRHLYRVEAELRELRAGPKLRAAVRASQSRMIVERLHRALLRVQARVLPQSLLGQAIAYALGQWPTLTVYLGDGRVEIDNNLVENAIRPTALGKKNWLFVGADTAGDRSAILYTVLESCRRRGLDPYAYLRDVLTRLPTLTNHQVPEITPANWARSRPAPRSLAA